MSDKNELPLNLTHEPIVEVKYSDVDEAGDARFLSLGKATWNNEDYSAKVWRWSDENEKWSRQSEELPLWRVLDLARLVIAAIKRTDSGMSENIIDDKDFEALKEYLDDNMKLYIPRINELKRILDVGTVNKSMSSLPNIFSFATSELSQYAVFSWLLQWANPSNEKFDKELCDLGKSFLYLLTDGKVTTLKNIQVGRQWNNIDIWAEINDDTFLIIEDKTNTTIHDNQLERYKKTVLDEYKGKRDNLFYVYVKTGNEPQATINEIKEKGYKTINRNDILNLLDTYKGDNYLIKNYTAHLQSIEDETGKYASLPIKEWEWYAWQGFYMALEKYREDLYWDYVNNASGGFMGAWWHFRSNEEVEMYLQFEEKKLCFKIYYEDKETRSEVRNKYHNRLMSIAGQTYNEIKKPNRFGAGTYMTIGVVYWEEMFADGCLDINKLVEQIRVYENIVDKCMKIENK